MTSAVEPLDDDDDDDLAPSRWPSMRQAFAHLGRVIRWRGRGGRLRAHSPECTDETMPDGVCSCEAPWPRVYLVRAAPTTVRIRSYARMAARSRGPTRSMRRL